ncbi:MAG TPA: DoxX family protein [Candidatus Cybelea sp.]|nr:DoxX family protein [Candidatus Cybelea sp.]
MNPLPRKIALPGLRWVLGLVVARESLTFMLSTSQARLLAHMGLPAWVRPLLGGTEFLAAILFLIPPTMTVGGYSLLTVLGLAIVVHLVHGEYAVDSLAVYFMAVLASMAEGNWTRPLTTP